MDHIRATRKPTTNRRQRDRRGSIGISYLQVKKKRREEGTDGHAGPRKRREVFHHIQVKRTPNSPPHRYIFLCVEIFMYSSNCCCWRAKAKQLSSVVWKEENNNNKTKETKQKKKTKLNLFSAVNQPRKIIRLLSSSRFFFSRKREREKISIINTYIIYIVFLKTRKSGLQPRNIRR